MKLRISREALNDISAIWQYTAEQWSVTQADRYYGLIMDEIEFLLKQPLSGKDCSHIRKNYRCALVKSHLLFYKVDEESDSLDVIRVLHQSMDVEARL